LVLRVTASGRLRTNLDFDHFHAKDVVLSFDADFSSAAGDGLDKHCAGTAAFDERKRVVADDDAGSVYMDGHAAAGECARRAELVDNCKRKARGIDAIAYESSVIGVKEESIRSCIGRERPRERKFVTDEAIKSKLGPKFGLRPAVEFQVDKEGCVLEMREADAIGLQRRVMFAVEKNFQTVAVGEDSGVITRT